MPLYPSTRTQTVSEHTTSAVNQPVPAGIIGAYVDMIGPTSGGGSGRRGADGTVRCGGAGSGASGVILGDWRPASWWGVTYSVSIGAPGVGGAAVTIDDTNGSPGTTAGNISLTSGGNDLRVYPGGPGAGGTSSGAQGGYAGYPNAASGASASGTGGIGIGGGTALACGGPAAGGITSANTPGAGANGRASVHNPVGGIAGAVDGALPTSGSFTAFAPGSSSGSGASSVTQAAQAGAAPVGLGCGSPGGAASKNGYASGAGADGIPGAVRIRWIYG